VPTAGSAGESIISSTAFRLSRIFAEGWNKARELSAKESDDVVSNRAAALNPYKAEPERSRWSEGFAKAIGNGNAGSPTM
jgi:hypothetical protein